MHDATTMTTVPAALQPAYLTPAEVAELLRTTRTAIYTMVQRGQLPGVTRIGRRILVRRVEVVRWLDSARRNDEAC